MPFTFGLSLPICAGLGGLLGAAADAAAGGLLAVCLSCLLARHCEVGCWLQGLIAMLRPQKVATEQEQERDRVVSG